MAAVTQSSRTFYLNNLSEYDSWDLFSIHAFGGVGKNPSNSRLLPFAKQIMANCDGNPLALRVVAASMKSNNQEKDWEDMVQKSLCTIKEKENNEIFQLVKISFD